MDKLLFRRILVAGLTALAIIYVVYLLLSANFNVVPTENAEQVTVTDKIYSNGYIIRDETYVKNTSGGVVSYNVDDGDEVKKGELLGVIYGDIKAILSGERTGLNYLQRMSGIATMTREYMKELEGTNTTLLDTRKTTPNMRPFEKYAVKVGGATNHRYNLSDGVLLKDNHIGAAGSITKAIKMAKAYAPFVRKIEIETETLEQVKEAVEAGADIIMLDNMDNDTMKKAVEIIGGRAETECSGNVTKERLKSIAQIGVDFVSCGALTHSAMIMDVSLKNLTPIE